MSCTLNFRTISNCKDNTIIDYSIALFNLDSNGAIVNGTPILSGMTAPPPSFSGVTINGNDALNDGISVDESLLPNSIRICLEFFTDGCGQHFVNECIDYHPLPKSVWSSDRLEPDNNGNVNVAITNTKGSTATSPADCLPMRIEVWTEDYGLWETIYGRECDNFANWTSDTFTTLGTGESILEHILGGTLGMTIDKLGWATANNWNYRAIVDGITDTSNLAARTNAQEITLKTYVGSNSVLQDPNCPSESINADNVTQICKPISIWHSGGDISVNDPTDPDFEIRIKPTTTIPEGANGNLPTLADISITDLTGTYPFLSPKFLISQTGTEIRVARDYDNTIEHDLANLFIKYDKPNGLNAEFSIWKEVGDAGQGATRRDLIPSFGRPNKTVACDNFDATINLFSRSTDNWQDQEVNSIYNLGGNSGNLNISNTNATAFTPVTFSVNGVGIYDMFMSQQITDGTVSTANAKIEFNYKY